MKNQPIFPLSIRAIALLGLMCIEWWVVHPACALPFEKELTISNCFWTTTTDCDEDSYASARWLVVDMSGNSPSNTAYIQVVAYYGEVEDVLAQTSVFSTPLVRRSFWVYGINHFQGTIAVFIRDGVSNEAMATYGFSATRFESPENDKSVSLAFGDWSTFDYRDDDGDGYYAYHRLDVNYNLCPDNVSQDIYYMVSACKHPIMAGPCPYYYTPSYSLDEAGELLNVMVGGTNGELDSGLYQIDVVAYDATTDDQLTGFSMIQFDKKLETAAQDATPPVNFSIGLVYLDDYQTDMDGDLYSRARDLYFDANVSSGTYTLTAKVLYKIASEAAYNNYYTLGEFTISGSTQEFQSMTLGVPTGQLDSNIYDFKIELYLGTALVAQKDQTDDNDLNDQWFETPLQDASLQIESCTWAETYDFDHDGTPSMGDLHVELNTIADADDVYLTLFSVCGDMVSYQDTTGIFLLDGSMDTTFRYGFSSLACGGQVLLIRASSNDVEDYCSLGMTPSFESMANDTYYEIDSIYWADTIDQDHDGYYSAAKLIVDVDGGPYSQEMYIPLSLCKHPILAGPCPYDTVYFVVDSAGRADSCVLEIGWPGDELLYGSYQVAFTVNHPVTNDYIIAWQYPEDSMRFEPRSTDLVPELWGSMAVEAIDLFPNPANQELYLQFQKPVTGTCSIYIMDTQGRAVYQYLLTASEQSAPFRLPTAWLPEGLFVLTVRTPQNNYTHKLWIQH